MLSELFYSEEEQNSVGARLIDLYVLPSRVFKITVPSAVGGTTEISVKMRLLCDKENQEVASITDNFGPLSRILAHRKHILARAVESIEGVPIEMPSKLKQRYRETMGRDPTPVEEKLWVFDACQSPILEQLIECYDELRKEQQRYIEDLKKKSQEPSVDQFQEMK
jgi:hypothetical protein